MAVNWFGSWVEARDSEYDMASKPPKKKYNINQLLMTLEELSADSLKRYMMDEDSRRLRAERTAKARAAKEARRQAKLLKESDEANPSNREE